MMYATSLSLFTPFADRLLLFQVSSRLFSAVLSACSVCRICHYFLFLIKNLIFFQLDHSLIIQRQIYQTGLISYISFFLCNYNRFVTLSKFPTYDISYLNKIVYIYVLVCVLIYMSLSQISDIKPIVCLNPFQSFLNSHILVCFLVMVFVIYSYHYFFLVSKIFLTLS